MVYGFHMVKAALPLSSRPSFRIIIIISEMIISGPRSYPSERCAKRDLFLVYLGRVLRRYFLIPRKDFYRRPDLQFTGRTIMGKLAPRGQEMCDTNVQYRGNARLWELRCRTEELGHRWRWHGTCLSCNLVSESSSFVFNAGAIITWPPSTRLPWRASKRSSTSAS